MDKVNLERKGKRERQQERCRESAVEWVGQERQIRKEGKEREAGRTRKQKRGRWQKERDIYLKRGIMGTLKGHEFFSLCPAIPEAGGHLKDLRKRGHTCLFCIQQPILLGNFWNIRIMGL